MTASLSTLCEQQAYASIMRGLKELDFGTAVPCHLTLTGDHAFPLAMNCKGKVLMAASVYGSGRIVVLGHESCLTNLPELVENALQWLRGEDSNKVRVGVHKAVKGVAENLSKSQFKAKVIDGFSSKSGVEVYVTDAYSVEGDWKDIVAFMKSGGGVLIAGQAWWWASQNPNANPLQHFPGNKVSGVAGIHFTEQNKNAQCMSVCPEIPHSWQTIKLSSDFKKDLESLLQGVSEFPVSGGTFSEILVHGPLAFPICLNPEERAIIAGGYYGNGRVIVVSHEGLLGNEKLSRFWSNVAHWLDGGRGGVVGVEADKGFEILQKSGLTCQKTGFKKDLSVFVRTAYGGDHIKEIQEFVAEGGGLLLGGHAWYWAQTHLDQNYMAEFSGNKILQPMGLTLLSDTVNGGVFEAPDPCNVIDEHYHFRHLLYRFARHVTDSKEITPHQEQCLRKLGADCANFLHKEDFNCCSFVQLVSMLTDLLKTTGMPQVSEKCPVKHPRDHLLLNLAAEVYKVCPDKMELMQYLIKDNPLLPVVYNHKVKVNVDTAEGEEWVSTGLYLSPGMKTYMCMPAEIINKDWKVQVGCQTDRLKAEELKRAPCVHERFPVTSEMVEVQNLWGGLIYLIAPPHTRVAEAEVMVQVAVPVPYYKSGETSLSQWKHLRTAPSPWAELEFENIILTVPSEEIRDLERPDKLAALWDSMMKSITELAVIPPKFRRKERFVCEVQISHGWMHAGYPVMAHRAPAAEMVNVEHITTKGLWGSIHELGHNQQRACWEFPPNTTEATCNLWSVYVHETLLQIPREKAHEAMRDSERMKRAKDYAKNGRNLNEWSMWVALETYLQLQKRFGWDAFKKVFAAYHNMKNVPNDNKSKMNLYAVTFSETVGMDLTGFFKAWGWPIEGDTERRLSKLPAWNNHPMA